MNETHIVRPRHIPFPVFAIACFELLRAALIGWAAFSPMRNHSMEPVPFSAMQVLTLDALFFVPEYPHSERNPGSVEDLGDVKAATFMNALVCLPIAGYCAYLGFGLLMRNLKACTLVTITSLFTVLFWLRGLLFSWTFQTIHEQYFTSSQAQSNILLGLLLNLLIFCYLAYDEAVAHAFLPQRKKPLTF